MPTKTIIEVDKPKTTRKPRTTKPRAEPVESQYTSAVKQIDAVFPPKFAPLFEPHRFKVLYGGRGSGKSWSIARALLLIGQKYKVRVLCCREIQQSISASVHKLLSDQIYALGLEQHYIIERARIYSPINSTEFLFAGLRDNVSQIKSYEGLNIVFCEEAQNISEMSWDTLLPTMRGEGFIPGTDSEVWVSFNPHLEQDDTYQRWVVNPPEEAWVCSANYTDNPWFPDALRREMERMKKQDYDKYLHIYEGQCRKFLEGAVYVNELKQAEEEERITKVGYDPTQPVQAFFDLGYADSCGIWLAQKCGPHVRVLKYIENSRKGLDYYLKELSLLPYAINHIWLPHDARQRTMASPMSIENLIKAKGYRVSIVPNLTIADGINAVRALFPSMHFDKKGCGEGIHHLRHYRFEIKENNGGLKDVPVHDKHSHACLTGDSMVLTEHGPIRIDQIEAGIKVWTPAGYSKVAWAGKVKQTDDLIKVSSGDKTLVCTPEHKIATVNGFLAADTVKYSDYILSGTELSCYLIGLLSRVTHTGFRANITGETSGARRDQAICTGQSGKTLMARFQKVITFIISTATPSTTTSPTSVVSQEVNICPCTPSSFEPKVSSGTQPTIAVNEPPNGTDHPKESLGTAKTESDAGITSSGTNVFAKIRAALSRLCLRILPAPSTATSTAKWKCSENAEVSQWVYDLTVENHACYQANGILVSNSDAMRYCATALRTPKEKPIAKYHDPWNRFSRSSSTAWMNI